MAKLRKKLNTRRKPGLNLKYHQEYVPPVTGLHNYLIFLYGAPKVGKTTFASEFDNVFFVKCEPGHKFLDIKGYPGPDDDEDYIKDWDTFRMIVEDFEKMGDKLDANVLCIDTVDPLYKLCNEYVCRELKVVHVSDAGYGRGWDRLSREWEEYILRFSNLGRGVIFIGHSAEKEIESDGLKVMATYPALQRRGFNVLNAISDFILFADTKTKRVKLKGGRTKKKTERVLVTKAFDTNEGGERSGKLPEEIPLSFSSFKKEVLKAQTKGK